MQNEGIGEIWELISAYITEAKATKFFQHRRHEQNKFWLLQTIESRLKSDFYENSEIKIALQKQIELLTKGKVTPFQAADTLLKLT